MPFDPAKFDTLNEPLIVRVEKLRGNTRSPVPLPSTEEGGVGGVGWSKDDVRGLEQWLVTAWAGGGLYEIVVTDSSQPQSVTMRWRSFYSPSEYPEKTPPPLAGAATQLPQPQPQVRQPMSSAFPNGLPVFPGVGQFPAPQPNYQQPSYYYPTPPPTGYGYGMQSNQPGFDPSRTAMEQTIRDMQAQMARERETALQQKYDAAIAAQRESTRAETARLESRFSELAAIVTQLAQGIKDGPANRIDPQIEALKENNRQLAANAEAERREREAERREREMKDLITQMAANSQRQIEMMQQQFTQMQQQMVTQGRQHDPLIAMFQEQQRMQIEVAKEQARAQQASVEKLIPFMMNPREAVALARESSNGIDVITNQVSRAFGGVIELQGKVMENLSQMQGGDTPVTLIKDGIERATDMAQRWMAGKTKEAIATQQAQAQVAHAQAQAVAAQAMYAAQAAQAEQQPQPPPRVVHAPPAPPVQQQLSGPNVSSPAQKSGATQFEFAPNSQGSGGSNGTAQPIPQQAAPVASTPVPVPAGPPKRHGRTDEEWFGPLMPEVLKMRTGVARAIESATMKPPRLDKATHKIDGIEPDQVANYILQAAMIVMQQRMPIPVMVELFMQQQFDMMMDVLLPDAPFPYKAEVIQSLVAQMQGKEPDEPDEPEEDDDDEESDENDGDDRKLEERTTKARPSAQA